LSKESTGKQDNCQACHPPISISYRTRLTLLLPALKIYTILIRVITDHIISQGKFTFDHFENSDAEVGVPGPNDRESGKDSRLRLSAMDRRVEERAVPPKRTYKPGSSLHSLVLLAKSIRKQVSSGYVYRARTNCASGDQPWRTREGNTKTALHFNLRTLQLYNTSQTLPYTIVSSISRYRALNNVDDAC
jgi:hypothetical protein